MDITGNIETQFTKERFLECRTVAFGTDHVIGKWGSVAGLHGPEGYAFGQLYLRNTSGIGTPTAWTTYFPLEGGTPDSFISESLKRLDEDWEGEVRGSFTVWYSFRDGSVSGFSIRTGKAPPTA